MTERLGPEPASDVFEIDVPLVDFFYMRKVVINGKEEDLGRLTKWSLILEVNHLPRIEKVVERTIQKSMLKREVEK